MYKNNKEEHKHIADTTDRSGKLILREKVKGRAK